MLTPFDDLPVHQIASTLDRVGTNDPRFFDRYWFVAYDPAGRIALATGLGVYRNRNVVDGFGSAVVAGTQHNVRVSRVLQPDFSIGVGPLRYEVIEGLKSFRLVLEPNEGGVAFDLEFNADFPAFEESPHIVRVGDAVEQDYRRFYQHGWARGTIEVDGRSFSSGRFWSFRDRSFGVRPGMAETKAKLAATASASRSTEAAGMGFRAMPVFHFGGAFGTDDLAGVCLFGETVEGALAALDGRVVRRGEPVPIPVTGVSHDIDFFPNGVVRSGVVRFELPGEETVELEIDALTAPFVYSGFGYRDGFFDGLGPGVERGRLVLEHDRYRTVDPLRIRDEGGRRSFDGRPVLDQPMRILANGRPGYLELVAGLSPGHFRYALPEGSNR